MRLLAGVIALAAISTAASAADDEYKKCLDKSDGTNSAWEDCGYAMMKRADERLNAAWKIAVGVMPGDGSRKALLDEQRAWNAYKEKSCMFYASDYGREGQMLNFPGCRTDMIDARTKFLKSLKSN
jgi:uncharacterized protein YecT (DUF1311 family)